jgi:inner membrane protein
VDPICHTLVGASLGATGLEKKTRYARTTLIIAVNLPDIDGLSHFWGVAAYAFRRGITHGIPAMLVLPVLLAVVMRALALRRSVSGASPRASFRWLLILSAIGVASHPALDWLNTYGMRWLMPMVDRWFYGDTLFIIDWIVWVILIGGLVTSRWLNREKLRWFQRPACAALALMLTYVGASFVLTQLAEQAVLDSLKDDPPRRLMASPVPLNPLERAVVLDYGSEYRFGTVSFSARPRIEWDEEVITKGDPVASERATRSREGRWFLSWARFPYSVVEQREESTIIYLADARYVRSIENTRRNFAVVALEFRE